MRIAKYVLMIFIMIGISNLFAQNERIFALGNTTVALYDIDLDLNLYDYGENIAGLILDRNFDVLSIKPALSLFNGNYRRIYDPGKISYYTLTFDGIKTLRDGVFRGYVTYEIEDKKDVDRILSRYPYNASPFYMTDSAMGNFLYNGPRVGFEYSFNPIKKIFLGIELNYQIVNGLKDRYSRANSLIRNIAGSFNSIVKLRDNFFIGGKIQFFDNKESIESKSEDLLDVEIFNYRGDTYSFKRRGQSISQTYREEGKLFGLQSQWIPFDKFAIALKGNYYNSVLRTQFPYGMLERYEEGFTQFEGFNLSGKSRLEISSNLLFGMEAGYHYDNSWSRISELAMMIWKWNLEKIFLGIGMSYKFSNLPMLFIIELTSGKIISDSSKYIDHKFSRYDEQFYNLKIGCEYELFDNFYLRTGYNNIFYDFDFVRGSRQVNSNTYSIGLGYYKNSSYSIDFVFAYSMQTDLLKRKNQFKDLMLNLKLFNY